MEVGCIFLAKAFLKTMYVERPGAVFTDSVLQGSEVWLKLSARFYSVL